MPQDIQPEKMAEYLREQFRELCGEVEIDESYFGGKRKGKRRRGAYNKAIVFGIIERHGRVYTAVVPNVRAKTLMRHIRENTEKGSVYYADTFRSYNYPLYLKEIEFTFCRRAFQSLPVH